MTKHLIPAALCLTAALIVAGVQAGEKKAVQSGPQVGKDVPGPFHPLNVTGSKAGEKACLYCANGANPVAVVFAREATPEVAALLKKLDACTTKNAEAKMGSYAVFCSDKEGLADALKDVAKKQGLSKLVLSIDNPQGPEKYKIAKDAAITVLLYKDFTVQANHAFRATSELNEKAINAIVSDVSKIVK